MSNYPTSRRQFLFSSAAIAGAAGFAFGSEPIGSISFPTKPIKPDDEAAWKAIATNYNVTPKVTNLENGYWGIMAKPVLNEYQRLTEFINRENTYFARLQFGEAYRTVREKVAAFLNVETDEIALTRGATEALQALIGGYNKLKKGDTVLYADLDYSEMKTAMLARRSTGR